MDPEALVISDLHLGWGTDDPLEDFRLDGLFAEVTAPLCRPGGTLVINGDFVDFAQIPPLDTPAERHLLWTEEASVQKLERALTGHPAVFEALAALTAAGGELVLVIGNHDLDLVWPAVQQRLRDAVAPDRGERVRFVVGHMRYAGVHIEHGHHFTPENCPRDPLAFVHEHRGQRFLERVWGTDFMLCFYNALEARHPYADNVRPMLGALWHGIRNRWVGGREVVRLLVFLKARGVPWRGVGSALLGDDHVEPAAVIGSFEEDAWVEALAARAGDDPDFVADIEAELATLSPPDRARVGAAERLATGIDVAAPDGPTTTLGVVRDDRQRRAAAQHLIDPEVTAVIFGHTHEAIDGALDGKLFNTGTWLPHLDLTDPEVKRRIKEAGGALTLDVLDDATLYTNNPTAARITPHDQQPSEVTLLSLTP